MEDLEDEDGDDPIEIDTTKWLAAQLDLMRHAGMIDTKNEPGSLYAVLKTVVSMIGEYHDYDHPRSRLTDPLPHRPVMLCFSPERLSVNRILNTPTTMKGNNRTGIQMWFGATHPCRDLNPMAAELEPDELGSLTLLVDVATTAVTKVVGESNDSATQRAVELIVADQRIPLTPAELAMYYWLQSYSATPFLPSRTGSCHLLMAGTPCPLHRKYPGLWRTTAELYRFGYPPDDYQGGHVWVPSAGRRVSLENPAITNAINAPRQPAVS